MRSLKQNTMIRRGQLAQAALDVISREGVSNFSMAAVAQEVGLVPSAIYRHFKGRESLLDEVINLTQKRMMANVQAASEKSANPLDRLRNLLMKHLTFVQANRGVLRIVMSEDVVNGNSPRKRRVLETIEGYLGQVERMAADGQKLGLIRNDIKPETVSVMFLGMIQSSMILWHMSEGRFDPSAHATRAWKIFESGICSQLGRWGDGKGRS